MKQSENWLKAYTEEANRLMRLSEKKRIEYVNAVIESLAQGLRRCFQEKNKIKRLKLLREFQKEVEKNKVQILVALLYTIKDEFRAGILKVLDIIGGE